MVARCPDRLPVAGLGVAAWLAGLLACMAAVAGCDAYVDADYQGLPVVTLDGRVTDDSFANKAGLAVTLHWIDDLGGAATTGERTIVPNGLPHTFEAEFLRYPQVDQLNDYSVDGQRPDEVRVGLAALVVTDPSFDGDPFARELTLGGGLVTSHVLAYVASDVQPGTYAAQRLGAPLSQGFHLLRVVADEDFRVAQPEYTACWVAAASTCAGGELDPSDGDPDCIYTNTRAAGCPGPSPSHDQLTPATDGQVEVVFGKGPVQVFWPGWAP